MSYTNRSPESLEGTVCRAGLVTLLVVQLIMGYEWLVSGICVGAAELSSSPHRPCGVRRMSARRRYPRLRE